MLHPYVVGGEAGPADNDEEDGDYSRDGEDDEKVGDIYIMMQCLFVCHEK